MKTGDVNNLSSSYLHFYHKNVFLPQQVLVKSQNVFLNVFIFLIELIHHSWSSLNVIFIFIFG